MTRMIAAAVLAWACAAGAQDAPAPLTNGAPRTPAEERATFELAKGFSIDLVAAYGDDGPGYIPTARAYIEGGYEPTVALASSDSEELLLRATRRLLRAEAKNEGGR